MIDAVRALRARLGSNPWVVLAARCAASVALVVALAMVGSLPLARARVLSSAPTLASPLEPVPPTQTTQQATPKVETPEAPTVAANAPASAPLVVLNTATAEQLVALPGIGPKRAAAILALRERLGGRFRRVEDLRRVKGIGPAALRRLKPLVTVDPPTPPPAPH